MVTLNIKCRKKLLIRLIAVLLVISPLFTWSFLREHVNKDGKMTVTGKKSEIFDYIDGAIVVSDHNSMQSQSNEKSNHSVGNSLEETPNREHKSAAIQKSEENGLNTAFVDEAKSAASRDHRGSPLVVGPDVQVSNTMTTVKQNLDRDHAIVTAFENKKNPIANPVHTRGRLNENNRANSEQVSGLKRVKKSSNNHENKQKLLERVYNVIAKDGDVKSSRRRNLIIMAQARTGSSFLGDALNQHPDVFYLFEPLHGVNRPSHSNDANSLKFLEGILHCKFNSALYVREIDLFRRFSSNALSSPPLCTTKTSYIRSRKSNCTYLNPHNMESTCKLNYSATVMKILTSRIPGYKVDSLLPLCSSIYCAILYLVRDPRAVIYSHMKVGIMSRDKITNITAYKDSPRPLIRLYSRQVCQQIEANVRTFQNLSSQSRHQMIRYENLATEPIQTFRRIYNMAGLKMTDSTLRWIRNHTEGGKSSEWDKKNEFSTKRNSKAVIDKWRLEMDPCLVDIIEESCHSVMKLLGYKTINRSEEVQYDLKVSLSDV